MKVEIRSHDTVHISGYVNVVERESRELNQNGRRFVEKIRAGTFAKALQTDKPIELKINHKRTLTDTTKELRLYEDNIGLFADSVVQDAEVAENARNGKLTGWSFGFVALADTWEEGKSVEHRTVEGLELDEVSILTVTPAYKGTSVEVRSDRTVELRFGEVEIIDHSSDSAICESKATLESRSLVSEKMEQVNPGLALEIELLKLRGAI